MARGRLDRTLRLDPAPANHPAEVVEIQFRDEWGKIVQRFDPALFGLPDDISAAIARAFRDHDMASSVATRTARWFALRVFGRFLREDARVRRAADLDTATIRRFITWLAMPTDGRRRGVRSQSGQFGMIRPVLKRAIADNPGLFAPGFAVPNNPIPLAGVQRLPQDRLTPAAMRALLAVCYAEIDTAWAKFQHGQTIVNLPNVPLHSGRTAERDRWIWKLHRRGHGIMPTDRGLDLNKPDRQRIAEVGGFRELEGYLHLTTDTLVAFYIVLLIQTAANAGPLRQIKRDCLVPHPLERHRVMVEWVKPRAGGKVKRMQRRSFDNRRRSPLPTMMPVARLRSPMVNIRLNERLAPFLALPEHQGGTWHLTTYQGRKTFSRFIGRRDRTGLTALQRHLGHVHRAMTDRAYVGTDFELAQLIDDQAAEETRKALEDLLLAPNVAGKAGVMLSERSPFRGRTLSSDVDGYITEILAGTDMRLGVCDWGYCLYRRETSACLGGEREPNPVLRTQSTCSTCANFAVTDRHRPVWEARLERNTALIQRDDLDRESRALAEARIQESRRILDQLDEGNAGDV